MPSDWLNEWEANGDTLGEEKRDVNEKAKPLDLTQFEGHTPGPWVSDYGLVRDPSRFIVAYAQSQPILTNARLIAAAPALLEEVKRLKRRTSNIMEFLCRSYGIGMGRINEAFAFADDCEAHLDT